MSLEGMKKTLMVWQPNRRLKERSPLGNLWGGFTKNLLHSLQTANPPKECPTLALSVPSRVRFAVPLRYTPLTSSKHLVGKTRTAINQCDRQKDDRGCDDSQSEVP